MKKGRHFSSGNVKVYCSGYGLIGNQTSWPALASNLWAPACRLLLKGMFGFWEDIRAAPGLSDIQGQRGDSCVTLQNTKKKIKKKGGGWEDATIAALHVTRVAHTPAREARHGLELQDFPDRCSIKCTSTINRKKWITVFKKKKKKIMMVCFLPLIPQRSYCTAYYSLEKKTFFFLTLAMNWIIWLGFYLKFGGHHSFSLCLLYERLY